MKLVYPAIFYPFPEGEGYTVEVPDLPGCVSEGRDLAEAIDMGTDAASGWILGELEDGNDIPKASRPANITPEENGIVSMLVLDMDAYAEKYGENSIRKNITIPAYMDTYLKKHHISLSQVVQDAVSGIMNS